MYDSLIALIQYLDSLDKRIYNMIKRYSDGTFVVYVTNYKIVVFIKMYLYTQEGISQALEDVENFINKLPKSN